MSFIFFFVVLLWFALFHCFGQGILTLFLLSIFLVNWACPLAYEFLGFFAFLAFSRLFLLFLSLKFSFAPSFVSSPLFLLLSSLCFFFVLSLSISLSLLFSHSLSFSPLISLPFLYAPGSILIIQESYSIWKIKS